jgi:hypothetical protein
VPSSRGSPIYPSVHTSGSTGPHSYTGTTMASWAYPRGSFVPSPRWQGASNYAPMIVPQGLVQVPSWNSYPVRSSHLKSGSIMSFHLVVICLVYLSCLGFDFLYQQGKKVRNMPVLTFNLPFPIIWISASLTLEFHCFVPWL